MHRKVSLVMPTYNRDKFIKLAIKYYLDQTYNNKELIIIDDGHNPLKIDPEWESHNIIYIYLDRRISLGEKMNIGIKKSSGDIIVKFDDDDYYAPNFIEKITKGISCSLTEVLQINFLQPFLFLNLYGMTVYRSDDNRCSGATLTFCRDVWNKVKFRDEYQAVDSYFMIDVMNSGFKYKGSVKT